MFCTAMFKAALIHGGAVADAYISFVSPAEQFSALERLAEIEPIGAHAATLYASMPTFARGSLSVLNVIIRALDAGDLADLLAAIVSRRISIFGSAAAALSAAEAALSYETFEQMCVWQLIDAEASIDVGNFSAFPAMALRVVSAEQHAEAWLGIVRMARTVAPTPDAVAALIKMSGGKESRVAMLWDEWAHQSLAALANAVKGCVRQWDDEEAHEAAADMLARLMARGATESLMEIPDVAAALKGFAPASNSKKKRKTG